MLSWLQTVAHCPTILLSRTDTSITILLITLSDISDEDFDDALDNAQHTNHASLLQQYENDLDYVINTTLAHGKHIAVTSPGGRSSHERVNS